MAWQLIPKTGGKLNELGSLLHNTKIYSCNDLQIGDSIQFYNIANELKESIITQIRPEGQICWIDTEAGYPIRTGMIYNAYRWETEQMEISSGGRRKKSVRRKKGIKRRRRTKRR